MPNKNDLGYRKFNAATWEDRALPARSDPTILVANPTTGQIEHGDSNTLSTALTTARAVPPNFPSFYEDPGLRSHVGAASCVFGSYLVGVGARPDQQGIIMWNGKGTKLGGLFPLGWTVTGYANPHLWANPQSTCLIGSVSNPRVISVTYSGNAAVFNVGEVLTQSGSGATAAFIRHEATSVSVLIELSGTWTTGASTNTGGDNGYTESQTAATVVSTDVVAFCCSVNGTDNFKYFHVDIGSVHASSVAFATDSDDDAEYILIANNVQDGGTQKSSIWYYKVSNLFSPQFVAKHIETDLGAIRHFHGLRVFYNSDITYLIAMTGDAGTSNSECSVLFCADFHSFITNGSLWKTRWGLNLTGAARNAWFALGGGGRMYALAYGSQNARVVDCTSDSTYADAASRYVYWLPDAPTLSTKYAYRVDMQAEDPIASLEALDGLVRGSGSVAKTLSDGTILLASASEGSGAGTFYEDKYCRLYAVSQDKQATSLLGTFERSNTGATVNGGYMDLPHIVEYPAGVPNAFDRTQAGPIWWDSFKTPSPDLYSTFLNGLVCGWVSWTGTRALLNSPSPLPVLNLIEDGRFSDNDSINRFDSFGATYISGGVPVTPVTLCTAAQETSIIDSENGQKTSLKLTPSGSGASSYVINLAHAPQLNLRGLWVTAKVCVYANHTQGIRLVVSDGVSAGSFVRSYTAVAGWRTFECVGFIAPTATTLTITLEPRVSGSGTTASYWSNVVVTPGNHMGRLQSITLPLTALVGARKHDQNGVFSYNVTSGDASGPSSESSRAFSIVAYGTPGVARVVTISQYYQVCDGFVLLVNRSDGATTFKISGQTGFSVAAGKRAFATFNGTDLVRLTADA